MKGKLGFIGIVVKDLEKAMRFYENLFGWMMPKTGPFSKILEAEQPGYKVRFAMLKANGVYIELFEPKEGPWLRRLEEGGKGAIWLLGVEVDDIEEFSKRLETMKITPVGRFDQPLEEKYITTPTGSRLFWLPRKKTLGTWIEILQWPKS